jgi:hypothetical protein
MIVVTRFNESQFAVNPDLSRGFCPHPFSKDIKQRNLCGLIVGASGSANLTDLNSAGLPHVKGPTSNSSHERDWNA